jgi:hypothetical protein
VERVAVDHLAAAQREDLHHAAVAVERQPEHVHGADCSLVRRLPLREVADREETIADPRRLLEPLVRGRASHPFLELVEDRVGVARQELDDALDDRCVVLLRDVADARRVAALDVEVEAGDPGVPARLRTLTRPELEDAVQNLERLAHLLRVRVWAEVENAPAVPLAREHDAREVVLDRHRDVGERLVVAEANVERGSVTLDQVLLEVQRLDFVLGDDHLDVVDPLRQLLERCPGLAALLEVRTHSRPQRLGLPDVENTPFFVVEEVDTRPGWQALERAFERFLHLWLA